MATTLTLPPSSLAFFPRDFDLEKETAAAIQRLMSILPAVLIVCLALVVAFVLAAVLLPIVSMELTPVAG